MSASLTASKPKTIHPLVSIKKTPDRLHEMAFDNSLQANIIFGTSDGQIIKANKAACKLLGYSKKDLLTRKRKDVFNVSETSYRKMIRQRNAEGSARADLSIIKKSGKILPCEITSVVFKNNEGKKNSILTIVDLRERLLKQKLIDAENEKTVAGNTAAAQLEFDRQHEKNKVWIKSVANTAFDVIWDWDITTNMISFGSNYEKVFGYKLPKNKISFEDWMGFFQPEERGIMQERINTIFETGEKKWQHTYQFLNEDGSTGQVISRANTVRSSDGKPIRMIGVIHDISKVQKLEEILNEEMRIKERQIVEAIVEAKEMERSDIGKELHDNINQLLGASILYLDMAREDIKNGDIYLSHSSEYTLSAIEEIRKLSKGLASDIINDFGLCDGIEHISKDIMETNPIKIHCMIDCSIEDTMSEKFKLNTFRIFQEQMNNILKHAKATDVNITLSKINNAVMLSIADNGVGFDITRRSKGIGVANIISRAGLYKGNANFISEPGKGCMLAVTWPAINAGQQSVGS